LVNQAVFYLRGDLIDLLPREQQAPAVPVTFQSGQSVKHLAEALSVPHTEIHAILVNGQPVDFSYQVQDGDRVELYPLSADEPAASADGLERFILDNHLGRLAVYLRMLGCDSLYRNDYGDEELARVSQEQERVLLTRDKRLLMRKQVARGYWVRSTVPRLQLVEVVSRYRLSTFIQPFRRCLRCNELLRQTSKAEVLHRLEPLTRLYYEDFSICPGCDQIYWKGSHYARMQSLIQEALHPE
jgi:uncharacterized protein with PIN domain